MQQNTKSEPTTIAKAKGQRATRAKEERQLETRAKNKRREESLHASNEAIKQESYANGVRSVQSQLRALEAEQASITTTE